MSDLREAEIIINGTRLTERQSAALRVMAITSRNDVAKSGHLGPVTFALLARLDEIIRLIDETVVTV